MQSSDLLITITLVSLTLAVILYMQLRVSRWNAQVLDETAEFQAGEIRKLEAKVRRFEGEEARRQAQRVDAARKAGEKSRAAAEARKRQAQSKTDQALKACAIPPRDQVVAGVRERRREKNSGAAAVTAKASG